MTVKTWVPNHALKASLIAGVGMLTMAMDEEALLDADANPEGSVKPTISMAEQILPCTTEEQAPGARALVYVDKMTDTDGNVRVQVYSGDPDEWLAKGAKLLRIDVPAEEDMMICVELPAPGEYALVVMHDKDADGRADVLSDGFGFSRNPALGLSQPDHDEVVMNFAEGQTEVEVDLTYMFDEGKKERKRRRRR